MLEIDNYLFFGANTSCNKFLAIAKLIGWEHGPLRNIFDLILRRGVPVAALPEIFSSKDYFDEFLRDCRQSSFDDLHAAKKNGASSEEISELESIAKNVADLTKQAADFALDIDDELRKGDNSELEIDAEATETSGMTHVTLLSLDRWAHAKYGIAVLERVQRQPLDYNRNEKAQKPSESGNTRGLSKTKSNNLYMTLALLVGLYSETAPSRQSGGRQNASSIANLIAKRAEEEGFTDAQTQENIRKVIAEAIKVKRELLRG